MATLEVTFDPVKDKDGKVILYDIIVGNEWIGSRRTINMCKTYAEWWLKYEDKIENKHAK